MGDIKAIGNAASANPATETYSYDPLYRLAAVAEASGNVLESVTYNPTGDRLSKTGSGLDVGAYGYNPNTHQLVKIGNSALTVDANGNTTAISDAGSAYGFGYSARNRMTVAQLGGSTIANYIYDALGQRIQKVANGQTESYLYNEAGQLLAEYGANNRDYIWMDGIPVANIDTSNGSSAMTYVTADQLGTPRAIADANGNTIWQLPYQGDAWAEQSPTSNGYTYNLRFAGQYADTETGLMHNGYRDYCPACGRYIHSDPVGMFGGQNSTYVYVGNKPLEYTDFLGLQADINTFPIGSSQWQGANNYQDPPGTFSVAGHGNPIMFSDSDLNPVLPQDLAAMIKHNKHNKHYKPGEPVYLLSCNMGVTPNKPWYPMSYAQFLANDLGGPVFAPNTFLWFGEDGDTIVTGAQDANGPVGWDQMGMNPNNISMNPNAPGSMIKFLPQH